MSDLAYKLSVRRIFTADDWEDLDPDSFHKYKTYQKLVLKAACRWYCGYSLYQIILGDGERLNSSVWPPHRSELVDICVTEGYNLCSLVYELGVWMWSGADVWKAHKNVIYIVGDHTTGADSFCKSILQLFKFVLTVDPENIDLEHLAKAQQYVKLLYVPANLTEYPFRNLRMNEIIAGNPVSILSEEQIVTIKPLKCIVRLKSLIKPDMLPTNKTQHTIIQFNGARSYRSFSLDEIHDYLVKVRRAVRSTDLECQNPFGWLCTSENIDTLCANCSRNNMDLISLAESD